MYNNFQKPVGYTFSRLMTTGENKMGVEVASYTSSSNPRLVRDILREMFSSDSPLAVNRRAFLARQQRNAEKGGGDEQ